MSTTDDTSATASAGPVELVVRPQLGYAVERMTWHPVDLSLPDAEITVLCWLEPGNEWFSGWFDGREWIDAASGGRMEVVTHWAEPNGPRGA